MVLNRVRLDNLSLRQLLLTSGHYFCHYLFFSPVLSPVCFPIFSSHFSVAERPYFRFGGSKIRLPSPEVAWIIKLIQRKLSDQVTLEKWSLFFNLGTKSWHRRCCRRCGIAGGERVPPAPLGWYSSSFSTATIFHFFSVATFSHRRSARIKKLI